MPNVINKVGPQKAINNEDAATRPEHPLPESALNFIRHVVRPLLRSTDPIVRTEAETDEPVVETQKEVVVPAVENKAEAARGGDMQFRKNLGAWTAEAYLVNNIKDPKISISFAETQGGKRPAHGDILPVLMSDKKFMRSVRGLQSPLAGEVIREGLFVYDEQSALTTPVGDVEGKIDPEKVVYFKRSENPILKVMKDDKLKGSDDGGYIADEIKDSYEGCYRYMITDSPEDGVGWVFYVFKANKIQQTETDPVFAQALAEDFKKWGRTSEGKKE
jgi:hypothetical protein